MGPDELDDLLASIRAEAKEESSGGALALYEGTRETDLVSESIDERILRLIGLEDVFDIDYGTYSTLLRERLAAARMTNSEIASDEDELLRDEFRRVRGKVGRFKISKKKISAGGLGVAGQIPISSNKFFLASKAVVPPDAGKEDSGEKTSPEIMDKLDQLIEAIKKDNKIEEKKQETERRQKQNKRREERENRLESISKPVQRMMKKVVAPFQNILDRIMKFVKFTLLGFAFNKLMNWFADPKNQKKIEVIGRFLKDWWPTLLGAAALFFTPLGKLVKGVVSLMRFAIPALLRIARRNPYVAIATLGAAAISGIIASTLPKKDEKVADQEAFDSGQDLTLPSFNRGGMNISMGGLRDTDGRITNTSGLDITGAGPDTQLIAAAPGEIVIPKDTVEMYGSDYFMNMIRSSGKTGVPQMINGIQLANQGGMVGGLRLPGTGRFVQPRTEYSSRQYGRDSTYPTRSQFRFLGIPIPGTERIEPATGRRNTTPYNTSPTRRNFVGNNTSPKSRSFVGDAFVNFGRNIQSIRNYGRRQEEMMRQLGVEPDGYTNLRGNPVMGPQSRVVPVGTPEVTTKMQTIVLPPTTMQAKKPTIPTFTGTKIPEFSITSRNTHRSVVSSVLGVSDLVG
jgi:hypothetical protein|tara:strand:+ start:50 stop:1927 length:1878 start_codon:yes stop_codon:yes gene_type:complete